MINTQSQLELLDRIFNEARRHYSEARLVRALRLHSIPEHMHEGVIAYIRDGRYTGDFLSAVLSNDLREAVSRADSENRLALAHYVDFFYNNAPGACWGSAERMIEWLEAGQRFRAKEHV